MRLHNGGNWKIDLRHVHEGLRGLNRTGMHWASKNGNYTLATKNPQADA